jgi:predicted permease
MLSDLWIRLRSLFHREAVERELREELAFHLEQQTQKNMRAGMTREQAARQARLELGGLEQASQQCREARGITILENLRHDVRYGFRMLRKSPAFTLIAVLTLALGIGATTAIFTLVNAVMLQSLPVSHPEQLVVLRWSAKKQAEHLASSSFGDCAEGRFSGDAFSSGCSLSYPFYQRVREQTKMFAGVIAFAGPINLDLAGNGAARMAAGELTSGNYFETLGVKPAIGRLLTPADEQSAATVAVLDGSYWKTAFHADPNVVGKTIHLNNVLFTIIGVADPGFARLSPGRSANLYVPLTAAAALDSTRVPMSETEWWLTVVARMQPGAEVKQAQAAVDTIFRNETTHGAKPVWKTADDPHLGLLPAQSGLTGVRSMFSQPLTLLMAVVSIILLITCANVAGLLLARGSARSKEIAVRMALGAKRRRVLQQLLTESLMLSFAGTAGGLLLAYWGAVTLVAFFTQNGDPRLRLDVTPDFTMLLFAVGIAVLTGLAFGLAPAFRGSHADVSAHLKISSAGLSVRHGFARGLTLGRALVVVQVMFSMVVIAGAGLMVRTLSKLHQVDPGFDSKNILLFSVYPKIAGYKEEQTASLCEAIRKRLLGLPGVIAVSYSSDALLDGSLWTSGVHLEGEPDKKTVETQMMAIGPDFFSTMKIPVVAGRGPGVADLEGKLDTVVVNRAFVNRFLGGRNPIGLHLDRTGDKKLRWQIIGVAGDTKYDSLRREIAPTAYVTLRQGEATFALRTGVVPESLMPAVESAVNGMDRNLPIVQMRTETQAINRSLFAERLIAQLFGLFAGLGLLLASIGVYGLLSYEVALQTREIGIRSALGAPRGGLMLGFLGQGLSLMGIGVVAGTGAAILATRVLADLLYGIAPNDGLTLAAAALILILVGLVACLLPARRATQVDPMVALRSE